MGLFSTLKQMLSKPEPKEGISGTKGQSLQPRGERDDTPPAKTDDVQPVSALPVKRIRLPAEIDDFMAIGRPVHSLNKHWTVGYKDPGPSLTRESRVQLRNNESGKILVTINSLARPFAAAVSDVGIFVVDDAGTVSELSSIVIAFDSNGNELHRRSYNANLSELVISPCGRYVASVTANAPNEDAYLLEVHDVSAGKIVFSRHPATPTPDSYLFEIDNDILVKLRVKLKRLGRFDYSADGEFLDSKKYHAARMAKGNYAERIEAARVHIATNPSQTELEQALASVETAISEAGDGRSWMVAGLLLKGRILQELGQVEEAVKAMEAARQLNPKAILKREIDAIAKNTTASPPHPDN